MTERQKIAFADPCYFGFETAKRKFVSLVRDGKYVAVLSLNAGYE